MTQSTPTLRAQMLLALAWSGVGQYGSAGLRVVTLLVLASLLPANAFGLLGLAMIVLHTAQGVANPGLAAGIIQRSILEARTLDTAFWANVAVGSILGLVTYLGAETATRFLGGVDSAPLLAALSLVFPIAASCAVPQAIITKRLDFRWLSVQQFVGEVGFALVAVGMALGGQGAASLVGGVLAHRLVGGIVLWSVAGWTPSWRFDRSELRRLVQFGVPFIGGGLMQRGLLNVDYFVVGRWLGTEALGYYSFAFQLGAVPLDRLTTVVRQVAFPGFSRIQADAARIRTSFLEGLQYLFVVATLVGGLVAVAGPWLIRGLYGDKWEPAVVSLQLLALGGVGYVMDLSHPLYLALGKPTIRFWLASARVAVFLAALALVPGDLTIGRVAGCMALAIVVTGVAAWFVVSRYIAVSPTSILPTLRPSLVALVAASLPVLALLALRPEGTSAWAVFGYLLVTVPGAYGLVIVRIYRHDLKKVPAWLRRGARS